VKGVEAAEQDAAEREAAGESEHPKGGKPPASKKRKDK
jgi:hypothetical protein